MTCLCEVPSPSRRAFLIAGGALFAWAHFPKLASAANQRDPRLIVIILRGALDGLSAVAPIGDPAYAPLHGQLALSLTGDHPALPLDGFFALNPAMPTFARLYKEGHAAVVHATATPYRQRSHFDGQDVLESGYPRTGFGRVGGGLIVPSRLCPRAIASRPKVASPLALPLHLSFAGPHPSLAGHHSIWQRPRTTSASRVMDLYAHSDPVLERALAKGLETEKMAERDGMGNLAGQKKGPNPATGMRLAAEGAAKLMAADDGPRIAALAFDGWDTHANEGGATGRLALLLGGLDGAFEAFESGLGPHWRDTAIVAITEFGRTARINGTTGTDHGTATVAFLVGGAVKGGRVIADWPGLRDAQLHEGRDLKPTTDLRAVLKGLLADQIGLSAAVLGEKVFPQSASIAPTRGLVA